MNTDSGYELATFAGGCFWCMEKPFAAIPGVKGMVVGYTGGHTDHPTYESVSTGSTGHVEAIQLEFDPEEVSYRTLLETFWKNIDPVDARGQFADRGSQYQTAIFWHNQDQKREAEASKAALDASGTLPGKVTTRIEEAVKFYPAEEYHQGYYKKQPLHYQRYHYGSGRPDRLMQVWGDENDENKGGPISFPHGM